MLVTSVSAHVGNVMVEGRVFTEAGPLPDALVSVHRSYSDLQQKMPAAATARTDKDGVYQLHLPPGSYHFTAAGQSAGRSFFAYHGGNPVTVVKEKFWLALLATPEDPVPVYGDGSTGIEGRITYKGKPLDGAYLALYKPESKTFKGLGVKTESVGADGRFRLPAEPGNYVVTARKIANGKSNRPLRQGDLYCYYSQNPVEVKAEQTARIEFSCYPKIDRNDFVATPTIKPATIKTVAELSAALNSGIRGRVTDEAGRPIVGMNVLAYRLTSPVFMMYHVYHGSEHSALTDQRGAFFIPLDADGDYGLVAREILGDGPHRGEHYGLYQENVRHAISFKQGQTVENVTIIAGKVMDNAPQSGNRVNPKIVIGIPGAPPTVLGDSVISRDTVWQGEIIVNGVISVQRGATLVIRPGTTVRFRKVDRDKNGVGDGEILVEGRLIAKGTPEQRIIFTSAEEKPAAGDWSYLQFLASNKGNIIEYCLFEYAFAGVMIHYADVKISDTIFRNNNRGLHYNTADLNVDHSTFIDNRIGIRFMRMEGKVKISNNLISRNDVGVLFVRQHVNAVNFAQLNNGQEAPLYEGNNIFDNRNYNFSLGEEQERDIDVSGNWWGSASKNDIGERIYDHSKHTSLSRIIFEPFLDEPVADAGVRGPVPEPISDTQPANATRNRNAQQLAGLSGRILLADGSPLTDGLLYLYNLNRGPLPSQDRYWRIPNQVQQIDGNGRFSSTQVPPGKYSIGAIKRSKNLHIGAPESGDIFILSLNDEGLPQMYDLKAGIPADLGDIREIRQLAVKKSQPMETTAIEGIITDSNGQPLEGVYAFAFAKAFVSGKPLFASEPSNGKGQFRLNLAEGGTYYLKARNDLGGGPPQTGLIIDGSKSEPLLQVSVNTGEVSDGIVLKTKTFPGRGRKEKTGRNTAGSHIMTASHQEACNCIAITGFLVH